MIAPRWRKVFRDLWRAKARTLLVAITIAVGVAGVGMIMQAVLVLTEGMDRSLDDTRMSSATLFVSPFDEKLAAEVAKLPDVEAVLPRTYLRLRIATDGSREPKTEDWVNAEVMALADYTQLKMDRIFPEKGAWPPQTGQLAMDRLSARSLGLEIGDDVWIEAPDGKAHKLTLAGTVRDPGREATTISGLNYVYVTPETLESLGIPRMYNQLSFRVRGDATNTEQVGKAAAEVRQKARELGYAVGGTYTPDPKKHWAYDIVHSMGTILESLGGLALLLGASLVVNTVLAIMTGQLRQIGVMKVLGADSGSLMRMYLGTVLIYGVLALIIGIPLGLLGATALTAQSYQMLNFDTHGVRLYGSVLSLQLVVGIVIPLLAALVPILSGIRITPREAIGGQTGGTFGASRIDRLLEKLRGLPRPLMLSLRNTFRRKGRLLLTLLTLSMGGAIVVSVVSVYASMVVTVDSSLQYSQFDVRVTLDRPQPIDKLQEAASAVEGTEKAEAWGLHHVNRVRPDGREGQDLTLMSVPDGSTTIEPIITEGRWLRPDDKNALVLESYLLRQEPDLKVGDEVELNIDGKKSTWTLVGFARKVGGNPVMYTNFGSLAQAVGEEGKASELHVVTKEHDRTAQAKAEAGLKEQFKSRGIAVSETELMKDYRDVQLSSANIVLVFLIMMTVLLTFVSAFGLTGTMSLNVMERTREIGIMRSVGASDRSIWGIVITEGVFIGLISWAIGSLLALPVSRLISDSVGYSLFETPLDFRFPIGGVLGWLAGCIVLSALASVIPAWNASRLAMREVLAYE